MLGLAEYRDLAGFREYWGSYRDLAGIRDPPEYWGLHRDLAGIRDPPEYWGSYRDELRAGVLALVSGRAAGRSTGARIGTSCGPEYWGSHRDELRAGLRDELWDSLARSRTQSGLEGQLPGGNRAEEEGPGTWKKFRLFRVPVRPAGDSVLINFFVDFFLFFRA